MKIEMTESEGPRGFRPWHCLLVAWAGMAMLWAGHLAVLAGGTAGRELDVVEGVIDRVQPTRTGGLWVRVLGDGGRLQYVSLSPSLGLVEGVASGRPMSVEGVWSGTGPLRHLEPMSARAVWVGERSEVMTVAAAREAPKGRRVWLRARVKDLRTRPVAGGRSSVRCVLVDESGELEATMPRARESDLSVLKGEAIVCGTTRTYYRRPAVQISSVSPP